MQQSNQTTKKEPGAGKAKVLPALCNILGVLLLVAVVGLCAPLTVPILQGYQTVGITSNSMAPAIPADSVIYVEDVDPSTVVVGDVIAYRQEGSVVAHRVTLNSSATQEFFTKADASKEEDLNPVPYGDVIGRVDGHVPFLAPFVPIYASLAGKVYLLLTAACGVMLNVLASRMREAYASARVETDEAAARRRKRGRRIRLVAMVLLAIVFLSSAGVIAFTMWQYSEAQKIYDDAADRYTGHTAKGEEAPISVDFDKLQKENPDIVGWIYCEGTVINYPVLQGRDNDEYLHTDYKGEYNFDGSIFVDADNSPGFVDSNTIIYGHHMNSGAMFAGLVQWESQEFYEDHPVIWLLTPKGNYKIVLFSGHHVSSDSSMYEIIKKPGKKMNELLSQAIEMSNFSTDVKLDPYAQYVMLSTCAYLFDGDRYVLHGILTPVQ